MPKSSESGEELTIAQIAEEKGIHPSTVRRWIAGGTLRAYKYGPRTIRIRRADLERMRSPYNAAIYEFRNGGDAA